MEDVLYACDLEEEYTASVSSNGYHTLIELDDIIIWNSEERIYEDKYEDNKPIKEEVLDNIKELRDNMTKLIKEMENN